MNKSGAIRNKIRHALEKKICKTAFKSVKFLEVLLSLINIPIVAPLLL